MKKTQTKMMLDIKTSVSLVKTRVEHFANRMDQAKTESIMKTKIEELYHSIKVN